MSTEQQQIDNNLGYTDRCSFFNIRDSKTDEGNLPDFDNIFQKYEQLAKKVDERISKIRKSKIS